MDLKYLNKKIAISGGFDPIHVGHLRMFQNAKELVGKNGQLIVILNDDKYLLRKKGRFFMTQSDRAELVGALACVDSVYQYTSDSDDVIDALRTIKPDLFGNGGDIDDLSKIREYDVCKELGIEMLLGLGGDNGVHSSILFKKYYQN